MTALTDHFGPSTVAAEYVVQRTDFPQQPEHLRPILDAFLSDVRRWAENDAYLPPPVYRKKWAHGAGELIQVLKADPWLFMPWAFKQFNKAFPGQRPESPGSLVFLVSRYKDNRQLCRGCGQVPEYCLCEEE